MQILSPIAGVRRSTAYQTQPPYTCYDALNMVACEPHQGRQRLGTRPGLVRYAPTADTTPVRMLERILIKTNDKYDYWTDSFNTSDMSHYTAIPNASAPVPPISDGMAYSVTGGTDARSFMIPDLPGFDAGAKFRFGVYMVPTNDWNVRLYFGMAAGGDANNGYYFRFNSGGLVQFVTVTAGVPTISGTSVASAVSLEGWLEVEINGTSAICYWRGAQIRSVTLGAAITSSIPAIGVYFAAGTSGSRANMDRVRVQYTRTANYDLIRPRMVYSQGGLIYREGYAGVFTVSSTTKTLASDRHLMAAERGQKLYIADHSEALASASDGVISGSGTSFDSATFTNWSTTLTGYAASDLLVNILTAGNSQGTVPISSIASGSLTVSGGTDGSSLSFRVERCPKIYDPVADTLTEWRATSGKGTVPAGCSIVFRYRDRLILAGDPVDPNEIYASRLGDPLDWLFSDADQGAAWKLSTSDAGTINDVIIAAAPYSDQYALIWGRNSTYRMSGDIAAGGSVDCVSYTIGCVDRTAWCHGSKGAEVFWLSRDGLYVTNIECPSCDVISLSRERLPRELIDVNTNVNTVSMAYDVRNRWVHIYITPKVFSTVPTGTRHWIFDTQTMGFFPILFATSGNNPVAALSYQGIDPEESGVITGGLGGGLYRMSWRAKADEGTSISSYVMLGPFDLGEGRDYGMVQELSGTLASELGDADWDIYIGQNSNEAVVAATDGTSAVKSGTFTPSSVQFDHPRTSGGAFVLKVSSSSARWAMEEINARLVRTGKGRA